MNKDSLNLSLKERFELKLSNEAVERELKKVKQGNAGWKFQIDQICCCQQDEGTHMKNKRELKALRKQEEKETIKHSVSCMNKLVYDSL